MGEQKVKTIEGLKEKTRKSPTPKSRKKVKQKIPRGRVYIQATYNNTIITVTGPTGAVLSWSSSGLVGFKGSRKSTPYAAQRTMEEVIERAKPYGLEQVDLVIKGVGSGRDSAIRSIVNSGWEVLSIKDQTPIPHGGVRAKKPRRV